MNLKDSMGDTDVQGYRINDGNRGWGSGWVFPSTSNKLQESNIMREVWSMTKTKHVVKAKDALIAHKVRRF